MGFAVHTWAKTALVIGYGAIAAVSATLYGSVVDGHEHGGPLHAHGAPHAHGSAGGSTAAHAHPDAAILVAAAGLGIVGLTWLFVPEGRRVRLPLQLALCSAAAATIHFAVVSPHWDEYVPFAVLFAVTGAFQFLWAAAVLVRPVRSVLLVGAVVNLGVAAAWVVSRTVGLPIGPEAWTPEPVGVADVAASVFELAIGAGAAVLLSSAGGRLEARTTRAAAQLAAVAISVTLLFALILL
ncbi:MAG: hypothetical protein ACJ74C_15280 [Gaiellaceae bacterium]